MTIEPRASLAYLHAGQTGFAESGAGILDQAYSATNTDSLAGELAARVTRRFVVAGWQVAPWAEAGLQETFSGLARDVTVTVGTYTAEASGISPAPTAGVVALGLDAAARNGLDLFLHYQGQFAANQAEHAFSAGLSLRF